MFQYKHGDCEYHVEFHATVRATKSLIKSGILQPRKSKAKRASDPPTRRCVECRISQVVPVVAPIEELRPVLATGMSVCSPVDKFNQYVGQKHAMRHAIARSREKGAPLTPDITAYLWDAFHKSHTPDALKSREQGIIRRKGF